jgi:hypothetical protein
LKRVVLLFAVAVMMVVMLLAMAGAALAAVPCTTACGSPPPGSSNVQAFENADIHGSKGLLNNGTKRQGPKDDCGVTCTPA